MNTGYRDRRPDLLPERIGEFGPFDVLSDWAHAHYVAGHSVEALTACAQALPLVQTAGDRQTASYLRYIECLVHEMDGHWARLRLASQALLDDLAPEAGPYWRAKVLGLQSHALIQQGSPAAAVEVLAQAYGLIMDHPGNAYNRASACHAVSTSLHSALLFGPAVQLLRSAQRLHGERDAGALYACVEEAMVLGTWGLFLQLLGVHREADARYVACASAAIRARDLADHRGDRDQSRQAGALLQFAYQRLRCEPVDERALRQQAQGGPPRAGLLPRLALASVRARQGDLEAARAGTLGIRTDARRLGEPVPAWVASSWLAELEVHDRGDTEATRRWRDLALGTLERLRRDREGRFEQLLAQHRVTQLSVRVASQDTRLWEDALTSVGNRRLLDQLLAVPGATARPTAFLDVDDFKAVNDSHGHDVGDEVLRRLALLLRSLCRAGDTVIRYGGDEFVVVLAEDGDVAVLADRIQARVLATDWESLAPGLRVSVTIGTAAAGPGALPRADAALLAHRDGRRLDERGPQLGGRPAAGEPDAGELDPGELDPGELDAGELDAAELDPGELAVNGFVPGAGAPGFP